MKNKNLVIGILAVLVIGAIYFFATGGSIGVDENGIPGFTYKCFNADHIEVSCSTGETLSVVQGVPGISYLQFTVSAQNTGDIPLTCTNIPISPTGFVTAMDTSSQIVDVGGTANWDTSAGGDVELAPLEALTQPVTFETTIRCKYKNGINVETLPDSTKQVQLTITSDVVNAGFNVDFNAPNVGSVVCGDGNCQVPTEDVITCPADCSV